MAGVLHGGVFLRVRAWNLDAAERCPDEIAPVIYSLENGNEPKARRAVARNRARRRGTAEGGGFRTFLGVRFQRHSTIRSGLFFACSPELSTDLTCTDDTGTDNWPTRMDAERGG